MSDSRRRHGDELRLDRMHRLLISSARPMKDIAYEMGVTVMTGQNYALEVYRREGVSSRVGLMHKAIQKLETACSK